MSKRYTNLRELCGVIGYEWRTRKAWRTRRAALRGLYWWLIRRYPCELCQDCGRRVSADTNWWHAPDELWNGVMGRPGWEEQYGDHAKYGVGGTVCPACFTARARTKGICVYWSPAIDERGT